MNPDSTLSSTKTCPNDGVHLSRMKYIEGNPVREIDKPKPKSTRRTFTDEERDRLLAEATPRLLPVWQLLLLTGMRRAEMCSLTLRDVVLDSPAPFLRVLGKGNKQREIPLVGAAVGVVRSLVQLAQIENREGILPHPARGGRTLVLPNRFSGMWSNERNHIGLPVELTLHCFRHTFATWLVNRTPTPLTEAARVLGHSSVQQTEHYVHTDQSRLREGMAALGNFAQSAPTAQRTAVSAGR